jgi:hypothetical protein
VGVYNAAKHPAVLDGRKTEEQVLGEFLETFEQHHNVMVDNPRDFRVSPEEFLEYYTNVSASIDDDMYFSTMMNSAWNLSGDSAAYKTYDKSWKNEDTNNSYKPQAAAAYERKNVDPTGVPTQRSGLISSENPFTHMSGYYAKQTSPVRQSMANPKYDRETRGDYN